MKYKLIKTEEDLYRVINNETGRDVSDGDGSNTFDLELATKIVTIARMQDAFNTMYNAVEDGDPESISHLAIRYKNLFGGTLQL